MAAPSGLFFLTGFEHQTMSAAGSGGQLFVAVNGAPTINTTVNRAGGSACMLCDSTAASNNVQTSPAISSTIVVTRFYLRIDSTVTLLAPSGNLSAIVLQYANASGSFRLDLLSDSTLRAFSATAASGQVSSFALASDRWYQIDVYVNSVGATAFMDWAIDGIPQTRMSQAQTSAAFTSALLGNTQAAAGSRSKLYFDDWILSLGVAADYPIGPGFIMGHVPVAVGTHATGGDFQNNSLASLSADTTSWNLIDEWPVNTTDYVQQVTSSGTAYLEYRLSANPTGFPGNVAGINGLRALAALFSSTTVGNNEQARLFDGTTESASMWTKSVGSTTVIYRGAIQARPTASSLWNVDDFVGQRLRYRWGYSGDIAPIPQLTALMVEVDYALTIPQKQIIVAKSAIDRRSRW